MNISQNISKLLYALSLKKKFYLIKSSKVYSEEKSKYITIYCIYKKEFIKNKKERKQLNKEKYVYQDDFYSKIDLMKYLAEEYKEGEANGK